MFKSWPALPWRLGPPNFCSGGHFGSSANPANFQTPPTQPAFQKYSCFCFCLGASAASNTDASLPAPNTGAGRLPGRFAPIACASNKHMLATGWGQVVACGSCPKGDRRHTLDRSGWCLNFGRLCLGALARRTSVPVAIWAQAQTPPTFKRHPPTLRFKSTAVFVSAWGCRRRLTQTPACLLRTSEQGASPAGWHR